MLNELPPLDVPFVVESVTRDCSWPLNVPMENRAGSAAGSGTPAAVGSEKSSITGMGAGAGTAPLPPIAPNGWAIGEANPMLEACVAGV